MKKSKAILLKTVIFSLLILFSGCKKLQDYILKHPGATHPDCRITKFTSTSNYPQKTGTIYYNKLGNPDSIIFDETSTGQGNFYFFYDNKNRLTDCIDMYISGNVDTFIIPRPHIPNDLRITHEWRKFIYDNNNRVIGDTVFTDKIYKPGTLKPMEWDGSFPDNSQYTIISIYDYDSKDRIVKTTNYWHESYNMDPSVDIYNYDTKGNLVADGRQYDDQVSFLRTHKLWMLLTKDYSINNAYPAVKYNSKGLPLEFDYSSTVYDRFLFTDMSQSKIEYSCK
ncbi:MAG: hypothetical protein M9904_03600 [Chitinophagaceae bacterium]|nr:hypothetical protein [Chitinophagaceae bacterium]